jgi:translation initiation factor IF-2
LKKVFQIAKELGVDSKAVVAKCQAEDIPNITNYQSSVSAGLEATIREWFANSAPTTAVETTEHVDIAKVRKASRPSRSKKANGTNGNGGDDHGSGTAVAEPPSEGSSVSGGSDYQDSEASASSATVDEAAPVEAVSEPAQETAPTIEAAAPAVPNVEVPTTDEPAAPLAEVAAPTAPVAPRAPEVAQKPVRPANLPPITSGPLPEVAQKPIRPPVAARGIMNVPTRPTNVSPVGQKVAPAPAQLKGPSVVRMEQPDNLPAPRPVRRPAAQGPQGPSGGGGGGGNAGPAAPGTRTPGFAAPGSSTGPLSPSQPGRGNRSARPQEIIDEEERAKQKARTARRKGGRSADAGVELIREWREADLADRAERIASASGVLKSRQRELSKSRQRQAHAGGPAARPTHVEIEPPVTIRQLSEAIGVKGASLLKKLMAQGVMATVNQALDADTATMLALEFGIELVIKAPESASEALEREYAATAAAAPTQLRPPVVTILGHVDHGKTSLLDKIRSANVAAGEAGGITQHIGAYAVNITGSDGKEKRVTFLDTPGHQAFTAMRARGANMTDVVVLVVAADDGVMPQTVESINHAKAAGVPIVVALNKIDKPDANANRVLGQLAENGLNPAEWGGDTEVVRTSAVAGTGVKELIEYLDYVATLRELKASPELRAKGAVIEAFMDPNRGVVARVLVQNGTLRIGDVVVCGPGSGRVRQLIDDKGVSVKEAGPSSPVELIGLDVVPGAGDTFYAVESIAQAKEISEARQTSDRAGEIAQRSKVTLENLFATIQQGDVKELRMILKADVQGSVDVLKQLMTEELSKEVKVRLLHAAVGGITESDVLLADASNAIIVGFSVVPDETARKMAETLGVEVRLYRIIYEITDDIRKALTGMLAPSKQDQTLGHAEIRQVIKVSRVGSIAGCAVTDGVLQRANKYRLIRDGAVVVENLLLDSLKRFKEDVKEVRGGMECGVKLAGYDDIKVGDRLEAYKTVDVARTL